MNRSQKTCTVLAAAGAALWSANIPAVAGIMTQSTSAVVLQFHMLFWAAAVLVAVLFLSGRGGELRIFNRRESSFLVLAGTGGYGMWFMRAEAFSSAGVNQAQLYFYTAPFIIGVLTLFVGRERAPVKSLFWLFLGLVGSVMLVRARELSGSGGAFPGLLAAACFAVFSLVARRVVQDENVLPTIALTLSIGAVCLLVTCVSRGDGIFGVTVPQMFGAALAGAFTVALPLSLWLRALSTAPAASAAPAWYLTAVFGVFWTWRSGQGMDFWVTFAGVVLVLAALNGVGGTREQGAGMTFGDVLRGG